MADSLIVHIVDDDESARQSLAFLLGTAGMTVRLYESAAAFLDSPDNIQDGCLITDVRMPDMTGIELLHELKVRSISLPTIVITGHGDIPLAVEAMKCGAIDFIEKPFDEEAIIRAVQTAKERVDKRARECEGEAALAAKLTSLSRRERQVLDGLVAGDLNKTIAHNLGISPRTVEVYRAHLMTKMQAKSLSDLVRMALFAGAAN